MTSPTEAPRGALLIQGLSVTIPKPAGEIRVLEDVSLDVPAGRAVAPAGRAGAGGRRPRPGRAGSRAAPPVSPRTVGRAAAARPRRGRDRARARTADRG